MTLFIMLKNNYRLLLSVVLTCTQLTACAANTLTQAEQQEALKLHNQYRAQHHAPNMTWDNKLASFAASHASACRFKHSHGHYGENIAAGYPTISVAIKEWYNEKKNYSYQRAQFNHGTGHFTQIVWKASTKLGCALVPCNGKNGTPGNYLVCEYNPPGNVLGRKFFEANVK